MRCALPSIGLAASILFTSLSWAKDLPPAIRAAQEETQWWAARSDVRNLFMFNYAYYSQGLCKDQDCSANRIDQEMASARDKMGDDFEKYRRHIGEYVQAIRELQSELPLGDLATLNGARSFSQIFKFGIFVTCVDFAKAVMGRAIDLGFSEPDIKFYVTMVEDGYRKMCPVPDGRAPILPRPVVHTLVAYRAAGKWNALNVEDPLAVPIELGTTLPNRLERRHQFTFPSLIAYQKLIYAGSYPANAILNGFQYSWLVSITANGSLDPDTDGLKCE